MAKKKLYPGEKEAELQKVEWKKSREEQWEPDFVDGKPNYDKYPGVPAEQVLVWLNID